MKTYKEFKIECIWRLIFAFLFLFLFFYHYKPGLFSWDSKLQHLFCPEGTSTTIININ